MTRRGAAVVVLAVVVVVVDVVAARVVVVALAALDARGAPAGACPEWKPPATMIMTAIAAMAAEVTKTRITSLRFRPDLGV